MDIGKVPNDADEIVDPWCIAQAVPASVVRHWLLPYCPAGVEFYLRQDEGGGYGSLMQLPRGVHRLSGVRYCFVTWREEGCLHVFPLRPVPVEVALAQVRQMRRALVPQLAAQPSDTSDQAASLANNAALPVPQDRATIRDWCEAQDPFGVIRRYVKLDKNGIGCCPFGSITPMARITVLLTGLSPQVRGRPLSELLCMGPGRQRP